MLFGRKNKPTLAEQIRIFLWPRRSWVRSGKYFVKRILRLSGSPYTIAAGVAAGAFTSFTPFLGFHFIISWIIAFIIGGNLLAAALGTSVGNPITFPFIWGGTYKMGSFILGYDPMNGQMPHIGDLLKQSLAVAWPTMKVMATGAVPLGLITAIFCFFITRRAAKLYQNRRRAFLAQRAHEAGRWREARDAQVSEDQTNGTQPSV